MAGHSVSPHTEAAERGSTQGFVSVTVWWVIFGGAKFREKSKPAFRINVRDRHPNE